MPARSLAMVLALITASVQVTFDGRAVRVAAGEQRALGAESAPVPRTARVAPEAVHGLKVDFYDFPQWIPKGIDSLEDAKNYVAANKPTLSCTVNSRSISFPPDSGGSANCDRTTLGEYLFGKAGFETRLQAAAQGKGEALPARLKEPVNQRSVFIYSGFVKVEKAGKYGIIIPVDDGDELAIGGVVVHSKTTFGGMTGLDAPEYAARVTIEEPGIYPVRVLHWDREQELGIHLFSDMDPRGEALGKGVLLPILQSDSGKPAGGK